MNTTKIDCVICNKEINGYGNNPSPLLSQGRCCDDCDKKFVMTLRFSQFLIKNTREKKEKQHDIIIKGIICNNCGNELPEMTVKQHLTGDFKDCCEEKKSVPISSNPNIYYERNGNNIFMRRTNGVK